MKVKVGDTVQVIAGADKGKSGKVIRTLKKLDKVVVEGIHIVKKHSKPTSANDKGGIFDIEAPIHVSNVKVITEKEAKVAKKEEKKEEVKKTTKTSKKTTEAKEEKPKASKKVSK